MALRGAARRLRLALSVRSLCEHAFVLSPNDKGNIAEAKIAAAATRLGIGVLRPTAEHGRYDLAFEVGDRLVRIQCKWARREGAVIIVNLAGYRYTARGQVRSKYAQHEIDAVVGLLRRAGSLLLASGRDGGREDRPATASGPAEKRCSGLV